MPRAGLEPWWALTQHDKELDNWAHWPGENKYGASDLFLEQPVLGHMWSWMGGEWSLDDAMGVYLFSDY